MSQQTPCPSGTFEILGAHLKADEPGAREDWAASHAGRILAHEFVDLVTTQHVTVFSTRGNVSPDTGKVMTPLERMWEEHNAALGALNPQGEREVELALVNANAEQVLKQYARDDAARIGELLTRYTGIPE